MPEREFWECTPRFFSMRIDAYRRKEEVKWEQARLSGFLALVPQMKKTARPTPKDVYPFPWEKAIGSHLAEAWKKLDPAIIERERKRTEEELARRRALKEKQKNAVNSRPERKDRRNIQRP